MATDCWFAVGLRDINSVHDLLSNSRHRFRASLDSFYTPFIIFAGEDPERIRDKIFCAILPSTSSPRVHPCHTFLKVAIDSSKSFPYALCLRAKDAIRMESITSKRGEQQLCKSRLPGEDNIHRSFSDVSSYLYQTCFTPLVFHFQKRTEVPSVTPPSKMYCPPALCFLQAY